MPDTKLNSRITVAVTQSLTHLWWVYVVMADAETRYPRFVHGDALTKNRALTAIACLYNLNRAALRVNS